MRSPIILPDFGSGDESIQLCGWVVDEGDLVLAGDIVAEALIPGVTIEIVAEATGRLSKIVKAIDSKVNPGDVLGWIELGDSNNS